MPGHVAVLANPSSGRGRGADAADAALERLAALGVEVRRYTGGSAADSLRLAREAIAEGPRALVVVGGDGTLSSVLDAVVGSGVPIALVPAGTGNDLARALGLPFEAAAAGAGHGGGRGEAAAEAAALVVDGRPLAIDVGEIESAAGTARFLTVAALGFDAHVSERTNRLRWPRGRMRYYLALLVELARLRPMAFELRVGDGASAVARPMPGTLVAIGNTRSYGGGMPMCPDADPADGLFDVTHVGPLRRAKLVRLFPLLLQGRHLAREEVTSLRTAELEVEAPGLLVYADGERVGEGRARFRVVPGALTMLVPGDAAASAEAESRS
jgi:diacylglycerol kinase (ATP)